MGLIEILGRPRALAIAHGVDAGEDMALALVLEPGRLIGCDEATRYRHQVPGEES